MGRLQSWFKSVARLYVDGFKSMTWGRTLWLLIILKFFLLFVVLRVFFFKPVLSGKTEQEKIEHVAQQLQGTERQ